MATINGEMEIVFLKAMAEGYVKNTKPGGIDLMPGSKIIAWAEGEFSVCDMYVVTPLSDKSTGQTIMWRQGNPVWSMSYGGWYEKRAIAFLKSCLREAYVEARRFYGGRGPHVVRGEDFTYLNYVQKPDFTDFKGEERIFDKNGQLLGYHWYRGGSLLR